jgi:hypothetical protein
MSGIRSSRTAIKRRIAILAIRVQAVGGLFFACADEVIKLTPRESTYRDGLRRLGSHVCVGSKAETTAAVAPCPLGDWSGTCMVMNCQRSALTGPAQGHGTVRIEKCSLKLRRSSSVTRDAYDAQFSKVSHSYIRILFYSRYVSPCHTRHQMTSRLFGTPISPSCVDDPASDQRLDHHRT